MTDPAPILVVGATGLLGSAICQHLSGSGHAVRAVVRPTSDPRQVRALHDLGAEPVHADLKDPASLERACRGVQTVITTATTTLRDQAADSIADVDHRGGLNLVAAAQDAGVAQVVYVSFPEAADTSPPSPLSAAKRAVEAALHASAMTTTVLHAAVFMDVWLSPVLGFDHQRGAVRVPGDGTQPVGWITCRDVARTAVACVDRPELHGTALTVVAETLDMNTVVRRFEDVGGRVFTVERVPVTALEAQLDAASTPLERSFAALMLALARGMPLTVDPRVADLGSSFTTVGEYARQIMPLGTPA
ncbi:uncharacterized protein YbjT (DUF2867 family) [Deinococcus metalli]|uniref:Uncharacterized protein YbjT (DUF2867 family) n=1 Tax=Deinococcus metalli TaxID=1141878 RepID=A0A7W8KDJ9_9DEIO|nr:NmrA family NAD(P)-binding protein [Deinococcus metalli]MBB5376212.1 uncharacterized protein YbjT (DUF2867 family) [Deinococcus metalli]GHF39941.1 hypothetical protein GCM10017781_15700 [Deinococcus metalli]